MANNSQAPTKIETHPLARWRVEQIESDLRAWADKPISLDFDPSGTHLFSLMELAASYPKRCADLASAIRCLISRDQIAPSTIIARSLIETTGMGCLYLHDMKRLIAAGDAERLNARLMRYFAGTKGGTIEPVHVMDAIRYLEEIDAEYATKLNDKYDEVFSRLFDLLKEAHGDVKQENFLESISVKANYDLLCGVAHPNGVGTQYLYPAEMNADVERALERFRHAAIAAIWQCHHLLKRLSDSASLAQDFRAAFLST